MGEPQGFPIFIGFFGMKFVALAEKFERYEEKFVAVRDFPQSVQHIFGNTLRFQMLKKIKSQKRVLSKKGGNHPASPDNIPTPYII